MGILYNYDKYCSSEKLGICFDCSASLDKFLLNSCDYYGDSFSLAEEFKKDSLFSEELIKRNNPSISTL